MHYAKVVGILVQTELKGFLICRCILQSVIGVVKGHNDNMAKLEVPDKGQAWVVAIAACIINMILSGLSRMIGILYVSVIEAYGVSRQEATLPFTVRNSIRCLSGKIVYYSLFKT